MKDKKRGLHVMTPMKWFYSFLAKYKWRMIIGMVLVTILSAASLASPYISKVIVDNVIQGQDQNLLMPMIAVLIGLVVV